MRKALFLGLNKFSRVFLFVQAILRSVFLKILVTSLVCLPIYVKSANFDKDTASERAVPNPQTVKHDGREWLEGGGGERVAGVIQCAPQTYIVTPLDLLLQLELCFFHNPYCCEPYMFQKHLLLKL